MDTTPSYENKKEQIMAIISDKAYKLMSKNELAFLLSVPKESREEFEDIINDLEDEHRIFITKKNKLTLPEKMQIFKGAFIDTGKGYGFVEYEDDDGKKSIYVNEEDMGGAIHKDIVFVRIDSIDIYKNKPEGTIVKILERKLKQLVGTYIKNEYFSYLKPDDNKIPYKIILPKNERKLLVDGNKVLVELIGSPNDDEEIRGKIIEVLGHKNDPGMDVLSILYKYEIRTKFPEEVLEQAEKVHDEVLEEECVGRRDLANLVTITIDGEDTKDIDDAVSISKLENGNYLLGVHIADVTHYVKENSPLDKEALKRGTSVYVLNTVVPMLPHKLSNGICSLNEGVKRLSLSCIMEIDNAGKVVNSEIVESYIVVNKRLTYTIVEELLTNENSSYISEYSELLEMLRDMNELREILVKKRELRGAIEFDFKESKIILNEEGKPIDVIVRERSNATSVIEEFMILCNETVSETYYWNNIPFVYRCHETPDSEKLLRLSNFLGGFGYSLKGKGNHSKAIQAVVNKAHNTPEEMVVSKYILRSLKQARYMPENLGHFGLASKYYSHFTSPIRRYPDLQIHRIIKENINGNLSEKRILHYESILKNVCIDNSKSERVAEECEREANSLKKVEFMADKIGQEFDGIISGITSWGIYVALENTIEGMIAIRDLPEWYEFNEENMTLQAERSKKEYRLGQKVRIKVVRANIEDRNLDFSFVSCQ